MINKIKMALRLKNNKFDSEIYSLIEASKLDLKLSGVKNINETDPLVQQAIIQYCKANFGLDNPLSQKYAETYISIKNHLALCGDYNVE